MSCICGQENCVGVCEYSVGARLARFLNEIDTLDTCIGAVDNSSKESLTAIGIRQYTDFTCSKILKPSSQAKIVMESKFRGYNDKSVRSVLKTYIDKSGCSNGNELLELLKKIEDNRAVLMPFKVKQICDVVHIRKSKKEEVNGKSIECRTTIESVKWAVNEEGILQCNLLVSMVDPDTSKKINLDIQDYGARFSLVDLERAKTKTGITDPLIKMTRFGYIKPIEIQSENNIVIIDNCSIYTREKSGYNLRVIGKWENGKIVYSEKLNEVKLEKAISLNETYLSKHRRWIAPYGICDTHKVSVK